MHYRDIASLTTDDMQSIINSQTKIYYPAKDMKTIADIDREIAFADKIMPIVTAFYNKANDLLMNLPENKFYDEYHTLTTQLGIRDLPPHCCCHTHFSRLAKKMYTQVL